MLNTLVYMFGGCLMCYAMVDLSFGKFIAALIALVLIVGCTIVEYSK